MMIAEQRGSVVNERTWHSRHFNAELEEITDLRLPSDHIRLEQLARGGGISVAEIISAESNLGDVRDWKANGEIQT